MKKQKEIPATLSRFELKYAIPFELIDPISDYVSLYSTLDEYSTNSDNSFYRVNNLYLDSQNYLFLRKRKEGAPNRFNMRVRSYGDVPEMPYFLEVKQKNADQLKFFNKLIDWELSKLKEIYGDFTLLYLPHVPIITKNSVIKTESDEGLEIKAIAMKFANKHKISFVDPTNDFIAFYEKEKILPHGFHNTRPGKGHLNKYGHEVVAKSLLKQIKER